MLNKQLRGYENFLDKFYHLVNKNRLPHALLLSGIDGLPIYNIAQLIAQKIHCLEPGDAPCGKCNSCKMVSAFQHPDLLLSFPFVSKDKSTDSSDLLGEWVAFQKKHVSFKSHEWSDSLETGNKQLKILTAESKRISTFLSLKPYLGKSKVIILYQPELLHESTANKLLKSIEEPLPNTHIILLSHSVERTLSTITSRCQIFNVPQVKSNEEFVKLLTANNIPVNELLVELSSKNLGEYLDVLNHQQNLTTFGQGFITWLRICFKFDAKEMLEFSEDISRTGRELLINTFESYLQHFRDAFIEPKLKGVQPTVIVDLGKLAPFIHETNIARIENEIQSLINELHRNANAKISIFDSSLKIGTEIRPKQLF